ncbi:enoyl-CoA hydratase/isomerase family protein [Streptomyces sp. AN091965]|uniref:enoyl-CoA hydratase/isomerase family protein n=1 Tax=Streptomyces sp. AN091965 TaxID=2927803 RepID=UPI001F616840|nr:enoyl-CoA hydratase/isomerase family protein [Streptomyces sp. AN091965]MCI3932340.1 enoyl-CoA hydratase/isomerase family protein [Streptomyces sp. AN091965]
MSGGRPAFPHIGWDPTPGDVQDTRDLARKLGGLARELGTSVRELERIECGAWKGDAARAFVEYVGADVAPLIRKSHESFGKASRALYRWARELQEFQDEADRLEKAAGDKLEARAKAAAQADGEGSKALAKASGDVTHVTGQVHDLEDRYARAADAIARELDKAGDIAPDEPGFWDRLTKGITDAWDATGKWLKDHTDLVKLIGDLLSDLTAVLAVLAIATLPVPPLAAVFGTAALLTSGLALASHGIAKAAGADVSWMQLGFDALGLLPGIGALGRGAKVIGRGPADDAARALGKGFTSKSIGAQRIKLATGDDAAQVTGGLPLLPGKVIIGGTAEDVYSVSHPSSGLLSRMGGLAHTGYLPGQLIGTKGLNSVPSWNIGPTSVGGRVLDSTLKIGPKIPYIPDHVDEAVN